MKKCFAKTAWCNVLLISSFVLVSSCAYHPPSPIEEHSSGMVKRQLNSDGTYYVRSGDTLYAIAFGYDVDPQDVARWNGISSPFTIYPGQKLRLTAPSGRSDGKRGTSEVQIATVKLPGQTTTRPLTSPSKSSGTPSSQEKPASTKQGTQQSAANTTKKAPAVKSPVSKTADPGSWKWPTKGRVIRTYLAGDPARNGLDIAGKEGQAVYASAAGKVVYSGNGLIGYGELIIIKHSEKMLSAYAHNKSRLAKEGDLVSVGQKIAEMGRNAENEQLLHFEIRAQGKPVNPLNYLPKK
jgi:lipoprotein NlpD